MASADVERVAWDTNLLLRYIVGTQHPESAELVRNLLHILQAPQRPFIVVMSTLVRAEIYSRPENDIGKLAAVDYMFFTVLRPSQGIRIMPVTTRIAMRASEIAARHNRITTPDAVHLATAIETGATRFWTYDGENDAKRNRSRGLLSRQPEIPELILEPPSLPNNAQMLLPDVDILT